MPKRSRPLVSVIIPVYNAQNYLRESIDSVVNQDIGFGYNIELILVNDGSTDGSGAICEEYAKRHPRNVTYVRQTNQGVSATRNKGIKLAKGELVTFLDADDRLSPDAVRSVNNYFKIARDYVDVAVIRVSLFGARQGPHYANGKFSAGTRTADLTRPEWSDVCSRAAQAFFRAEALEGVRFDQEVTLFEDTKFVNQVLAKKMRLGVVSQGAYLYRVYSPDSDDSTSLTTGAESDPRLYTDTPEKVSLWLLNMGKTRYFQYVALSEMRWRTFYNRCLPAEVLSPAQLNRFRATNARILGLINVDAILTYNLYTFWQKLYLIGLKLNRNVIPEVNLDNAGRMTWNGSSLFNLPEDCRVHLSDIEVDKGTDSITVKGYFYGLFTSDMVLGAKVNGVLCPATVVWNSVEVTTFPLERVTYRYPSFSLTVPLSRRDVIRFAVQTVSGMYQVKKVSTSARGNVASVAHRNQIIGNRIIRRFDDHVTIYAMTFRNIIQVSLSLLKLLVRKDTRSKLIARFTNRKKGRK